ncbi:MAG: NADH-quinone oxidoreductase subunit J [Ignavibacteria bacterium]|nr:NADH-quinone oxidoreductase subunit J [Ignavibacteria bacterium]
MSLYDIIFYVFAITILGSAVIVVTSKNIIYSAFSLLFTFFGVSGIYILLNADFIAVVQLIVYVGGILVLILFGVMLTNKITNVQIKTDSIHVLPATIAVGIFAGILTSSLIRTNWRVQESIPYDSTIGEIGKLLVTTYLLPFELAAILLLIALIGAVMIARKEKEESL